MKPVSSVLIVGVAVALSGCGQKDPTHSGSDSAASQPASAVVARAAATFSDLPITPKPPGTPELLARGKQLYAQNCEACHGAKGNGKGDAAAFLAPKPRDFVTANYRLRS